MTPRFLAPSVASERRRAAALPWHTGGGFVPEGPADASVVIPTYNAEGTLCRTLESLANQDMPVEIIVVDGGSTDGTMAIVRRFQHIVSLSLSAPDQGISDAFNRGIAVSRGGFIKLLNADDYIEADFMRRAVEALSQRPWAGWTYGGVKRFLPEGSYDSIVEGQPDLAIEKIRSPMAAPHPSWLVRTDAYEHLGLYSTNIVLAMDYEWLFRALSRGVPGVHCPGLYVNMQRGGRADSNRSLGTYEKFLVDLEYRAIHPLQATALFVWRMLRLYKKALLAPMQTRA